MGGQVKRKRLFRPNWTDLSPELMRMTHDLSEVLFRAKWVQYGGAEAETGGRIESHLAHPSEFYDVGDTYPEHMYIWENGRYERAMRRVFRIPEGLVAENLAEWLAEPCDYSRTREFSPANNADDARLIEALIRREGGNLWEKYVEALSRFVYADAVDLKTATLADILEQVWSLTHASPEQRIRAAWSVIEKPPPQPKYKKNAL